MASQHATGRERAPAAASNCRAEDATVYPPPEIRYEFSLFHPPERAPARAAGNSGKPPPSAQDDPALLRSTTYPAALASPPVRPKPSLLNRVFALERIGTPQLLRQVQASARRIISAGARKQQDLPYAAHDHLLESGPGSGAFRLQHKSTTKVLLHFGGRASAIDDNDQLLTAKQLQDGLRLGVIILQA